MRAQSLFIYLIIIFLPLTMYKPLGKPSVAVDALVVLSVTGLGAGITYVMVKFELSLCQSLLPCFPQSLLRVAWLLLKTATVSILEEWSQILGRDGVPPGAVMRLSRTPQAEAASSASPAGDGQPPGFL